MLFRLLLSCLLCILTLGSVQARTAFTDLIGTARTSDRFLPVEEAFQFFGYLDAGQAVIFAQITPEHYLYKERLRISSQDPAITLAAPKLPQGEERFDPFQNRQVETYSESFEIRLPYTPADHASLDLAIEFQGCAEAGLCYPPETARLTLQSDPIASPRPATASTPENTDLPAPASEAKPPLNESGFGALLRDASLPLILGLFFVAGLGLTFTPCVLPMVPILSSVIIGQRHSSRTRILGLTLTYVLSMAATFALAGMLVGLFGAGLNLQAKLQSPWVLLPLATLFGLFSLSLFGLYELQLPAALRDRLDRLSQRQRGGHYLSVALLGLLSSLVISPCVSAPLAGALLYISTTGDALLGGLALFVLGLGMGVPLLLVGTGAGALLPRAGAWMQGIKALFGVLLLAMAIWLLERLLPAAIGLLLWGSLLICCAVYLGALNIQGTRGWAALRQGLGLLLLVWGILLIIGAAQGNRNPLQPLQTAQAQTAPQALEFIQISTPDALEQELNRARALGKPALVDLYADWCIACIQMERNLFPRPEIRAELARMHRIRLDITANTPEQQVLLQRYRVFGPPALLFFDASGRALEALHLRGEPDAVTLFTHLQAANSRS